MNRKLIVSLLGGLILSSLTGCGSGIFSAPEDSDITLTTQTLAPRSATMAEPTEPQQEPIVPFSPTQATGDENALAGPRKHPPLVDESTESVNWAKQDLAQRLKVSIDSITVVAVIGQEYSTEAFYCQVTKERIAKEKSPQVVSGQNILLSASGRRYEYHASGQTVIFCRSLP